MLPDALCLVRFFEGTLLLVVENKFVTLVVPFARLLALLGSRAHFATSCLIHSRLFSNIGS